MVCNMRHSTFYIFMATVTSCASIQAALTGQPSIAASTGGLTVMAGLFAFREIMEEVTKRKARPNLPETSPSTSKAVSPYPK